MAIVRVSMQAWVGVAVLTVVLSACGGGSVSPTATSAPPPATATVTPAATATLPAPTLASTATPTQLVPLPIVTSATPTMMPSRPVATPATPLPASSGPPVFPTQPRNPGQPVAQTAHFRFYDPEGVHAATIAALAAEAEEIYAYLVARTGLQLGEQLPVIVQTQAASECAARGIAYQDGPRIGIFATAATPLPQLRMILAHETAHALHMPHYGRELDVNLVEGFANWASLRYWSAWQGFASFDDAARGYLATGRFVPLDNPPGDCTIATRDVLYNERASFVGYLIDTYGLPRFLQATATAVPYQRSALERIADYDAVYDQPFGQLLDAWVASLAASAARPVSRRAAGMSVER